MSAKKKVQEMVLEYYNNATDFIDSNSEAKEASIAFAMMCIDEKIKTFYDICGYNNSLHYSYEDDVLIDLLEMKKEIENYES